MTQLNLFESDERPSQAESLAPRLLAAAEKGVFLGTSSWKYEGWLGRIYTPDRYLSRGRLSQRKFEAECLAEYARVFPIVGGDFSFYQFPSTAYWKSLFEGAPAPLRFGLKVPEDLTVPRWPPHARYGSRAGTLNEAFLNVKMFKDMFARPLWNYRDRVAVLIFEFGTFAKSTFPKPGDFLAVLEPFLEALPPGFRYSIEIRNPEYLGAEYFDVLKAHQTAHVFNAWTRMPELVDQIELPGAFTADFTVVRALLRRGRSYEQAVRSFSPYEKIQEPFPEVREGVRRIAERSRRLGQPSFVFVNNRLEGNAPDTIEAILDLLGE